MATFATAVARVLRTINRPATEPDVLQGAKDAINDAVKQLQRDHAYAYTESLARVLIPGGSFYTEIGEICGGKVRDYISAQQLTNSDTFQGKPIRLVTYTQAQTDRWNHSRRHGIDHEQAYVENQAGRTIEDSFRNDITLFIANQHIGGYPKQSTDVEFMLHFHLWLPEFNADADTNFFLDYALDLVIMLALKNMAYFMKSDNRLNIDNLELNARIETLKAWDSQVRETSRFSME